MALPRWWLVRYATEHERSANEARPADCQERVTDLLSRREVHLLHLEQGLNRALQIESVLAAGPGETDPAGTPDDCAAPGEVDDQRPAASSAVAPHSATNKNTSATTSPKRPARYVME